MFKVTQFVQSIFLPAAIASGLFLQNANAQSGPSSSFPDTITCDKNIAKTRIPGTKIFINPPEGYTLSEGFSGMKKGPDLAFRVFEDYNNSYEKLAVYYTKEGLLARQEEIKTVNDLKSVVVNGYKGTFFMMTSPKADVFAVLSFGNDQFSVTLLGRADIGQQDELERMKAAFQTVCYDTTIVDPEPGGLNIEQLPTDNPDFALNDSLTRLKVGLPFNGRYMTFIDTTQETAGQQNPSVLVLETYADTILIYDFIQKIVEYNIYLDSVSTIKGPVGKGKINGCESVFQEIETKNEDNITLKYFVICLRRENLYYSFLGVTDRDYEVFKADMQKLVETIHFLR
jgi:hypothetical protein